MLNWGSIPLGLGEDGSVGGSDPRSAGTNAPLDVSCHDLDVRLFDDCIR